MFAAPPGLLAPPPHTAADAAAPCCRCGLSGNQLIEHTKSRVCDPWSNVSMIGWMTHRFELLRLRIAAPGVVRVCGFYGTRCAGAHADQYLFAASYFCTHTHTVKYMLRATFNDRQRGPAGVSSSVEMMSAFHVIRHINFSPRACC